MPKPWKYSIYSYGVYATRNVSLLLWFLSHYIVVFYNRGRWWEKHNNNLHKNFISQAKHIINDIIWNENTLKREKIHLEWWWDWTIGKILTEGNYYRPQMTFKHFYYFYANHRDLFFILKKKMRNGRKRRKQNKSNDYLCNVNCGSIKCTWFNSKCPDGKRKLM